MARRKSSSGNLPLFDDGPVGDSADGLVASFELGRPESLTGPGQYFPTPPARILRGYRLGRCNPWFENQAVVAGFQRPAGADEAGRGALFGPVLAAAVILDPARRSKSIYDSKQVTSQRREELESEIKRTAIGWSVAAVDAAEIDRINIYQASRMAMRQALLNLKPEPDFVFVDALRLDVITPQLALIHGDALCFSIAAASILAKVERDRRMQEFDRQYPGYNLARNKGYGTAEHCAALRELGPTPQHRRTYSPVAQAALGNDPQGPVARGLFEA